MQAMKTHRLFHLFLWLVLALAGAGLRAQPAAEPSVHDIYQVANQGDIAKARAMVEQVISRHPGSAKAHYVKAELAARDKDTATARSELQTAEKLAPGLPFVQPAAVAALRTQVDRLSAATPTRPRDAQRQDTRGMGAPPPEAQSQSDGGGFPLGRILLFGLVALGVLAFVMRRRAAQRDSAPAAPYAGGTAFGRGYGSDVPPGVYPGQPGMGPGAYPPGQVPPQGGMGSSIARGVATGLAVGAGAVAAQEIGRRMFDHERDGRSAEGSGLARHPDNEHSQLARDAGLGDPEAPQDFDMGGQDFGIQGDAGWDDAGDVGGGGDGGDWDT
jgi:uncharacterized protein